MKKIVLIILAICLAMPFAKADIKGRFQDAKTWGIQLENIDVDKLAKMDFDVIVIDHPILCPECGLGEIDIKKLKKSGKVVLAYMSLGQAQMYRPYWKPEWENQEKLESCIERYFDEETYSIKWRNICDPYGKPEFLGDEIKDERGNFEVKYWYPAWWDVAIEPYLEMIIDAGFDGVYLDNVDNFMYWGKNGFSERSSADRMITLVGKVRNFTNSKKLYDFIIVPQGLDIVSRTAKNSVLKYLGIIDGIGAESLLFDNGRQDWIREYRAIKNYVIKQNKKILNIEYLYEKTIPKYAELREKTELNVVPYRAKNNGELDEMMNPIR